MNFIHLISAVLSISLCIPVLAFDKTKVTNGLYYNGTSVGDQIWTPLVLVQDGVLLDPFIYAQKNSLSSLSGIGRTTMLRANTAFLFGGCRTQTELQAVPPIIADVPTVYVSAFIGKGCSISHVIALENLRQPNARQASNSMPTLLLKKAAPEDPQRWLYGVPGILSGKNLPIFPMSAEELGGEPSRINGIISRAFFSPLPVIEPDEADIAYQAGRRKMSRGISILEATHRSSELTVSDTTYKEVRETLEKTLWPRYFPKLKAATAARLGGVVESFFEIGLIQGTDISNSGATDYVGVARIGVVSQTGVRRWVDVVWSIHNAPAKESSVHVVGTSEDALYATERYFSSSHPSLMAPSLVLSGFADFDNDGLMELICTLFQPIGIGTIKTNGDTYELTLRSNSIFAFQQAAQGTEKDQWSEIFRTVAHEVRVVEIDRQNINVQLFGE
jgi:hypothetical protein